MSLIVEAVSSALGASRSAVHEALEAATSSLASARGQIKRRIGTVLGRDGTATEAADQVILAGAEFGDQDLKLALAKLIASVAGVAWGVSVVNAALTVGGTTVAIGLGLALEPILALLVGIVIVFVAGYCAVSVIKELWSRLQKQMQGLSAEAY